MKGKLVIYKKHTDELSNTVKIKVWQIQPTKDKPFGFKYSLVHIVNGKRVLGYDNAEGKKDHKHINDREIKYEFLSIRQLIEDFFSDMEKIKRGLYEG